MLKKVFAATFVVLMILFAALFAAPAATASPITIVPIASEGTVPFEKQKKEPTGILTTETVSTANCARDVSDSDIVVCVSILLRRTESSTGFPWSFTDAIGWWSKVKKSAGILEMIQVYGSDSRDLIPLPEKWSRSFPLEVTGNFLTFPYASVYRYDPTTGDFIPGKISDLPKTIFHTTWEELNPRDTETNRRLGNSLRDRTSGGSSFSAVTEKREWRVPPSTLEIFGVDARDSFSTSARVEVRRGSLFYPKDDLCGIADGDLYLPALTPDCYFKVPPGLGAVTRREATAENGINLPHAAEGIEEITRGIVKALEEEGGVSQEVFREIERTKKRIRVFLP